MRYKTFTLFVVACVLLLAGMTAFAGNPKQTGTTGASELLIPVGARSTALSGSNIATVSGIDAIYWNPAGGALVDGRAEAILSYQNYIADLNVTYFGAIANMGQVGNFGMTIKTISFGDIEQTTVDNPEGNGLTYSPNYLTLGMHYSRKFTDRIQFGINGKMISEKIMSVKANGFGLDIGLQYRNENGLRLGIALSNFGTSMKFDGSDLEYRVSDLEGSIVDPGRKGEYYNDTPASSVFKSTTMEFELPTQLKIGIGYDMAINDENMLSLSGTYSNNSSFLDQYIAGVEYSFNNMFFLRGSYSVAYKLGLEGEDDEFVLQGDDYLYGPAFGAGFNLSAGRDFNVKFDYAYQTTEFFDDTQWFGFTFGF